VSTKMTVTGCLKFKFLTVFQSSLIFVGIHITLKKMKTFRISQGSVETFSGMVGKCIRTNIKYLQDSTYKSY